LNGVAAPDVDGSAALHSPSGAALLQFREELQQVIALLES